MPAARSAAKAKGDLRHRDHRLAFGADGLAEDLLHTAAAAEMLEQGLPYGLGVHSSILLKPDRTTTVREWPRVTIIADYGTSKLLCWSPLATVTLGHSLT